MMLSIEEIYKEYAKTVYYFLYSYTKDADLSEEITQETFVRAIKSINRYNGKCKMSVWLCQIAKHVLYQKYYKNKKENSIELRNNQEIIIESAENIVITTENKKEIYKSIQVLEVLTKEVIYLRLTGELSFKEIGEILNKTENWARVTFFRGKSKIIRSLKK